MQIFNFLHRTHNSQPIKHSAPLAQAGRRSLLAKHSSRISSAMLVRDKRTSSANGASSFAPRSIANLSVRNWSYRRSRDQFGTTGLQMKRLLLPSTLIASLALINAAISPAQAGGGDVAAGLVGGLAAGTIIGAAVAGPRYYAPPAPVYVAPGPSCYWTRGQPMWDGYRGVWVYPSVQVCE